MIQNPESTQFGTETVTPEEKTAKVRGVFDSVADQYDLMNDLMSGGVHRLWKNHLIRKIRPKAGLNYLDVAGGTGDIAFRIKDAIEKKILSPSATNVAPPSPQEEGSITLCDLNWDMLRVGRDRAIDKGWLNGFDWVTGNAESLPLPSDSIDVYTIAFGLRNVTRIDDGLKEAYRVLKPGGRFFCLEFSHVKNPLLSRLYDGFSFGVIPHIGQVVANDRASYQYLVESIRKFPKQNALKQRMIEAGFAKCSYDNLSFGIAAIHYGIKI
ncbi:MAG: class I SAM-dependent methyltransferase [Alphaproteobacteria bacterium]|nr:class I SAM-dependent methyltransferase [Alphaproteobacteria bacterium]